MEVATYILLALGVLGATDIAVFHSLAHGIRSHKDSRMELFTHSLRGPTYAALFVLIPNFAMRGTFALALVILLVIDLGISIWDFSLERRSRRALGGLPSGEYVLHIVIAMLFGALVTSIAYNVADLIRLPTQLAYAPAAVPGFVRAVMLLMAILVLMSGAMDAWAAIQLGSDRKRRE